MRFIDVNNPPYKQYWFYDIEGLWLLSKSRAKPYFYYLPQMGKKKRWTRSYHVDMEEGQTVIKYVGKGRARWWEVHEIDSGVLHKTEDHQGLPPHIQAYVDRMKEAKVQ